jgi:hypothetical protein
LSVGVIFLRVKRFGDAPVKPENPRPGIRPLPSIRIEIPLLFQRALFFVRPKKRAKRKAVRLPAAFGFPPEWPLLRRAKMRSEQTGGAGPKKFLI